VSEYRISELAERTGFPPSTLRFYEQVGLLEAPERTAAGYRTYDDKAVERLVFVAQAKRLGFALDDIVGLVELWAGGECGPVHQRLQRLVGDKLADVDRQREDLADFAGQLAAANRRLAVIQPSDADQCGEGCSCTLEPAEIPARVEEWQSIARRAVSRTPIDGGLRLQFQREAALAAELASLAAAEAECCTFFHFTVDIDASAVTLEVTAPPSAGDVVQRLVG
jgi:DNA-binding transcriptional MerR regulator